MTLEAVEIQIEGVRTALVIGLLLSQSACGIAVQSVLGWSDERSASHTVSRRVEIEAEPVGTRIHRETDGGRVDLGTTPLRDQVDVVVEDRVSETRVYGVLIGGAVELALVIGGAAALVNHCKAGESCDAPELPLVGVFAGSVGLLVDLIALLHAGSKPDEIIASTARNPTLLYRAERPGHEPALQQLVLSGDERIRFRLAPEMIPTTPESVRIDKATAVVAVMPVSTASKIGEGTADGADGELLYNVESQLRVNLAKEGLRTVDRGAQEAALKAQVTALQAESFRECYDEACQVDLGKALAASHLLRSRVARFGSRCVLSGELIDLSLEVSIAAGSVHGLCGPESFLDMSAQLATELARGGARAG